MSYEAPVLFSFEGDPEALTISLAFNATALQLLGAELSALEALATGESAALH